MATQTSGLPIVFGVKVACRAAGGAVPAASLSLGKVLPVIVSAGMKALVLFSFCWLRFFLSGDTLYTSQTLIWSFMDNRA